ncbi:MAG TPA: hypothetical protein VFC60_02250 [Tissierellaceae bacterium]|nr:hypothetical protein [Tissierellaceae bacterium]
MENLEKLAVHLEFGKILIIIAIVSILLTCLMYFIVRKNPKYKLVKYIPGFIFTLIGGYNLFNMGINLPETDEFNMFLLTIIFIVAGLVGLLTGLIIGIVTKEKKVKKPKKTKKA